MTNPKNNYRNLIEIQECKLCKISKDEIPLMYLEVDHINGNHSDNRKENLQVLCKVCHSIKSKFSNQGKGLLFYFLSKLADESKSVITLTDEHETIVKEKNNNNNFFISIKLQ